MDAKEIIKKHLDGMAEKDEAFRAAYENPKKNLEDCFTYILNQARRHGNAVCMSDEEVFGMAVHYYVEAMREEGAAMHHCVFTNGYYKKPESLILSARDEQGKRLETIEVNLTVLKIAQCYGACNKFTKHHQEILELVNDNMWRIRERRNQILEAV